jgi:hypothetical protein
MVANLPTELFGAPRHNGREFKRTKDRFPVGKAHDAKMQSTMK